MWFEAYGASVERDLSELPPRFDNHGKLFIDVKKKLSILNQVQKKKIMHKKC